MIVWDVRHTDSLVVSRNKTHTLNELKFRKRNNKAVTFESSEAQQFTIKSNGGIYSLIFDEHQTYFDKFAMFNF